MHNLGQARVVAKQLHHDGHDMFTNRWVIIAVIIASLVIPLVTSCGISGDLYREDTPQPKAQNTNVSIEPTGVELYLPPELPSETSADKGD